MFNLVLIITIIVASITSAECHCPDDCKKYEVWNKCPEAECSPYTCSDVGFPMNCSTSSDCNPRCICTDGKVKNDDGNCIPPAECPECGGDPNAIAVDCARLCPDGVPCIALCVTNTCKCREGYELDKDGQCVPIKDCRPTCGINEELSTCANGGCGKWNCTQIGEPDLCIDPIKCEEGCVCIKGHLRARNGTCIPEKQCYIDVCDKAHEIYDLCPVACPARTCGINDKGVSCKKLQQGDPDCPSPICRCQNGFYRDHKGECVTLDQCPRCSSANETYHPCPPKCPPRRCDVDDRVIRCVAPPKLGDSACEPSCICLDGYARNDKGHCVIRDDCPKCTKPHEVYDYCPKTCPPQTCDSIGKVYFCPPEPQCKQCEGQCVCKTGYYRNKKRDCIPKKECCRQ